RTQRPNPPMQPTPLRGPKIRAILKAGFGPNVVSIYDSGAADGQAVGRQSSINPEDVGWKCNTVTASYYSPTPVCAYQRLRTISNHTTRGTHHGQRRDRADPPDRARAAPLASGCRSGNGSAPARRGLPVDQPGGRGALES